ncbi:MAG TPA: histidine kinase [Candidatus Paceibacterota bacterium]|nr:histidine kinase [Candidatus Paceibacterota bacterium]
MTITERHRIALELHDGIAQDLVGIGYALDLLLAQEDSNAEARISIRTLRFTVTDLVEKVRREIYLLREGNDLDLNDRLRAAAEQICPSHEIYYSLDQFPTPTNLERAEQIERIATEALRNISAHAQAKRVWISLICNNGLAELIIADDGVGGLEERENHYGFSGIRERAINLEGDLDFKSSPSGTQIHLRVPYPYVPTLTQYGE